MTLTKLAIGGVQIGQEYGISNSTGKPNLDEIKKIFNLAHKSGVRFIDTAQNYKNSEKIIGNIEKSNWNINTKLSFSQDELNSANLKKLAQSKLESSFNNLKTKKIYSLMLHNLDCLESKNATELWKHLNEFKHNGLVKKIGYSIYRPEELELYFEKFQPDIIQTPFNILDQRIKSSGWLEILKKENIEVHARSLFLQGLLLMNKNDLYPKFKEWSKEFERFKAWLKNKNLSKIEGCLFFAFNENAINKFVVGVNSMNELKEIIDILNNFKNQKYDYISKIDDKNLLEPINW